MYGGVAWCSCLNSGSRRCLLFFLWDASSNLDVSVHASLVITCYDMLGWYPWAALIFSKGVVDMGEKGRKGRLEGEERGDV